MHPPCEPFFREHDWARRACLVEGLTQATAARQPSWPQAHKIDGLDELPGTGRFLRVQSKQALKYFIKKKAIRPLQTLIDRDC